jgi:peptide/nickel transport system substrate-binding protein
MSDVVQAPARPPLGLVLALALLSGCQFTSHESWSSELRYASATPLPLDQPLANDPGLDEPQSLLFSSLYAIDAAGRAVPDLVTHDEVSQDGLEWYLDLAHDARWHDDVPFDAADVVATLERLCSPRCPLDLARTLTLIESAELLAQDRVRIKLSSPWSDLRAALADVPILPAHLLPKEIGSEPLAIRIGCGPYRLARETDAAIYFERWDHYHGTPPPFASVVMSYVANDEERAHDVIEGKLDLAPIRAQNSTMLKIHSEVNVLHMESGSTLQIAIATTSPPFDDRRVRQALSLLIDRDEIVRTVLEGAGAPLLAPLPPHCSCSSTPSQRYAPDVARELLTQAGFTRTGERFERGGTPLTLRLIVPKEDMPTRRASEVLAAQLKNDGVSVERNLVGDSDDPRGFPPHDARLIVAIGSPSTANFLRNYLSSNGPGNVFDYRDAGLDRWIDELSAARSDTQRDELCAKIQGFLDQELPLIPLVSPQLLFATRASADQGLLGDQVLGHVEFTQLLRRLSLKGPSR